MGKASLEVHLRDTNVDVQSPVIAVALFNAYVAQLIVWQYV